MSLALGALAAIFMTFSVAIGYWFLLSYYLMRRQGEHSRAKQDEVSTRIAARLAAIRGERRKG
jgi:hypothetical protein